MFYRIHSLKNVCVPIYFSVCTCSMIQDDELQMLFCITCFNITIVAKPNPTSSTPTTTTPTTQDTTIELSTTNKPGWSVYNKNEIFILYLFVS